MAVLMKYIYQNRRGVNSNFFSSLILFSFLFIYHFWNDVSGHTSIWFVKMSRVLHSFLSLEKIFPPALTFEQVRLWLHSNERLNLHRFCTEIFHTIFDKNESMAIHLHTQLFSFQFRIPERELKRSLSKCYERLFFHRTDICGIPRSFCSLLFTG